MEMGVGHADFDHVSSALCLCNFIPPARHRLTDYLHAEKNLNILFFLLDLWNKLD
jgi:hypothetical protein